MACLVALDPVADPGDTVPILGIVEDQAFYHVEASPTSTKALLVQEKKYFSTSFEIITVLRSFISTLLIFMVTRLSVVRGTKIASL